MSSTPDHIAKPFAAYSGDEPYLFVSYAHQDAALVYPELERLKSLGANVWYDEGISPGSQWSDELATRIDGCRLFVYLVTPRSVASQHCRDEAFYALDHNIPLRAIHLEATDLPPGLQLRLGARQAILKHALSAQQYETKLVATLAEKPSAENYSSHRTSHSSKPARTKSIVAVLFGLMIITALWLFLATQNSGAPGTAQRSGTDLVHPGLADLSNAMAILPFALRSADPANVYLSDGMAETLVSKLQVLQELSVLSTATTAAYANRDNPVVDAARELGVPWVVHGSVQIIGDNIRITTQLTDTKLGTQRWTNTYDGQVADVFSIQDSLAADLLVALDMAPAQGRIAPGYQPSLAAYEQLILGRSAMDRGTAAGINRAADHFREAIRLDPQYADAYVKLAEAYGLQDTHTVGSNDSYSGMPSAAIREQQRPLIEKALELNPESGAAYAIRGTMEADPKLAQTFLERALELSPGYAPAYVGFANLLLLRTGDFERAAQLIQKAADLDPLSPMIRYIHAKATWSVGQPEAALEMMIENVRRAPEFSFNYKLMARWQLQLGEIAHGLRWIRTARQIDPDNPSHWGEFGGECYVLVELGLDEQARFCTAEFIRTHPDSIAAKRDKLTQAQDMPGLMALYEEAVAQDPGNFYRVNQWLFYLSIAGDLDGIKSLFERHYQRIYQGQEAANDLTIWPTLIAAQAACAQTSEQALCERLLEMAQRGIADKPLILGGGFIIGTERAKILMLRGQPEQAIAELARIRAAGWSFLWRAMPMDFAPLDDEPGFQEIFADVSAHAAAQRADYEKQPHRPLFTDN